MFTGIVEEVGKIVSVKRGSSGAVLTVEASVVLEDVKPGDSIAVNGVCLTASSLSARTFSADVMHETMDRSNLRLLRSGDAVNLERAMAANGRFGGHIVSGHVDGTGTISRVEKDDNAVWYTIEAPPAVLRYIVEKGSVAIDGISLTVAAVTQREFRVSVIPHTRAQTTLTKKAAGSTVNIENDCIGKYVEKLLMPQFAPSCAEAQDAMEAKAAKLSAPCSSGITQEFLEKFGF